MKKIAIIEIRQEDKEKGFTLIELLVVISIIALLSTIVLGALGDARTNAKNTRKNEVVSQYVNALELYRSDSIDGTYPNYGDASGGGTPVTPHFACIGYYNSGETCFGSFATQGDEDVDDALSNHFGELPKESESIDTPIENLRGVVYGCKSSTDCSGYQIQWFLEGINKNCGPGEPTDNDYLNMGVVTRCAITK